MKLKNSFWLLLVLLASCGGAATEASLDDGRLLSEADGQDEQSQVVANEGKVEPVKITEVHRPALDILIEKGPAYTLGMVQIDSYKEKGRFLGFKIVSFRVEAEEVLGLKAGDVVVRVNGLPIERPEQYFEVFEKLKTADEITFSIIRGDEKSVVRTPIIP